MAGFSYIWRKMEAAAQDRAGWSRVVCGRELHGDGVDGTTAVMGLNFMTHTAGMGSAFTVVPREW